MPSTHMEIHVTTPTLEELKNSNGDVIALGEYDVASHTLTYKFTSTVNNLQNVTGSFNLTQFMDRQVAKHQILIL